MSDIAASLGVSTSTVSLALRDSPVIAESTRRRVREQAAQLGYVYNRAAANLRTKSRHLVGLVVPDIANPFAGEAALGLQEALAEEGHFVVLSNTLESVSAQTRILRELVEEQSAGIVLVPALTTTSEDLQILRNCGVPAVLMNRPIPSAGLRFVDADGIKAVDLAIEHLRDVHAVQSVGYFGGLQSAEPRRVRLARFIARAESERLTFNREWSIPSSPSAEEAFNTTIEALAKSEPPEAILCHDDSIAIGLLHAFTESGITPSRCRVIGIDGIRMSAMTSPSLTTVAMFPDSVGRTAGRMLRSVKTMHRLKTPQLIIRKSCGCA